ncbi:phage tail tape measure protein [Bradyrhizobium sp. 180]|uniref:phage tail tape measure protein n=1 Tax=Bradyrhizobium sp. 180 TaxID=2782650 RepID=UPI001FF96689|nr:phage tail tape measure protein [Bradyrhizobium sp. 180]MCK1489734.1 phage tail tape measure protein [Bradyrhizobium sp. 180]
MSDETLHVSVTLSATETASPVLKGLQKNLDALRASARKFNAEFSSLGRSAFQSLEGVTRASKSAADSMRGFSNVSERAAASYRSSWAKADQDREKSASRMYSALMRDERQYQALLAKRSAATSPRGSGPGVGKIAGGTFLGVGAASAVRQLGHDVIATERSIGRGIASAFAERLKVSRSETQSEMFADLSSEEVRKLRKNSLDRLGIKFGAGIEGTLGVATELSKAGIGKEVLGDATELVLKAKTAMDISSKETAELFGGLASFIAFDKNRYGSISNSIAIANRDTKSSGTEIIEGMKRGFSALATTGGRLSPEQLAGLVGTAIDVGIQPGKSGNFISHFVGAVGSADSVHGQKSKDMQEAAQNLGFGSRGEMARSMRNSPMESIYKIFDNLARLPEKLRIRVAKDLGGEMWFDEILSMVLAKDKLKQVERDIETDKGFLDKAALKSIRSMSGAAASVMAAAKLAQEKIGGGLDKAFAQIADSILRHADTFNFDSIRDHFEALTDGLLQGFGLKNWGQAVDWLVSQFSPSTIETWKSWGRGFAAGIKSWGESLMSAFSIARRLTGSDPESTGKLVANLAVLATSLIVVNPLLLLLAGAMALLTSPFALFIASVYALKKALDWVADKMFTAFVSVVDAVKNAALSMINKVRGWVGLSPIGGEGTGGGHGASGSWSDLYQKQSGSGFNPADVHPMNYLGDKLDKFGGKIERASLMSTDFSSRGHVYGGGLSGSTAVGANMNRIVSGVGTPDALIKGATPGGLLPNFGVGSGGIIRRGGRVGMGYSVGKAVTSGTEAAVGAMSNIGDSVGVGLGGSAFLAARRARFAEELKNDPNLRLHLAAIQATEGASRGGTIESLMNRADMQGKTLRQMLGFSANGVRSVGKDGKYNSFYGPIRRGEIYGAIERLKRNPREFANYDAWTQKALAGNHAIGGYTDQGLATDPNGSARTGIKGFKISPKDGNEFTDWVGPGSSYGKGRQGAINYRKFIEQHINNVPAPADAIKNVPSSPQSGVPMRGDFGIGGRSNVAIHINGNSHDPEALATLVQRRVDESMNWRAHDSESEYT